MPELRPRRAPIPKVIGSLLAHRWSWRRGGPFAPIACAVALGGCGPDPSEVFSCRDLLPVEESGFRAVADLVTQGSGKGCSKCHNTRSPVYGFNFEGPGVTYDALSTKIDRIYAEVASGDMPKPDEGETGCADRCWDEVDLQLLRSWYCYGAVYDY